MGNLVRGSDHRVPQVGGTLRRLAFPSAPDRLRALPCASSIGGRAADIRADQSDRHRRAIVASRGRSNSRRPESRGWFRGSRSTSSPPRWPYVGLGLRQAALWNREQPQLSFPEAAMASSAAGGFDQRPFHVRLAAADPDVADQQVFKLDVVPLGDRERGWLAVGRQRSQLDLPLVVLRLGRRLPGRQS